MISAARNVCETLWDTPIPSTRSSLHIKFDLDSSVELFVIEVELGHTEPSLKVTVSYRNGYLEPLLEFF